jgi:lipid-binding SYLF domain-containing protein
MSRRLALAVALGFAGSSLVAACGQSEECGPYDVLSGAYRIEKYSAAEGAVAPIQLEGGTLRVDREAGRGVLEYPEGRGTVTFRITSWPPEAPPSGEGGTAGAR